MITVQGLSIHMTIAFVIKIHSKNYQHIHTQVCMQIVCQLYIYMAEVVLYSDHCSRLKYTYDNSICVKIHSKNYQHIHTQVCMQIVCQLISAIDNISEHPYQHSLSFLRRNILHAYKHTYIHTYIYTYIHTYIHTYVVSIIYRYCI